MIVCGPMIAALLQCGAPAERPAAMVPTARLVVPAAPARPVPAPPAADRWLAEDKLRHFALSFAATEMTYGGARFLLGRDEALGTAAGVALLLGVAKEVRDQRGGGPFSVKDLAWDAAGVALGVFLARRIR